jgi:small subunit ribosomal protein S16
MLKIRLRRVGAKKQPSYRVVVADSHSPRGGRFVETIGFYNPLTDPPTVRIDEARALHWLSEGAQPTDVVGAMLKKGGTIDRLARLRGGEDVQVLAQEAAVLQPEVVPEPAAPQLDAAPEPAAPQSEAALEPTDEVPVS